MSEKKIYVDYDIQDNSIIKLKADTVLSLPTASTNEKRIVYYNGDYYFSDGTGWTLMSNLIPTGGTTGQVLSKASNTNYDLQWVNQSGGGGGILFGNTSGTDTYTVTIAGVTGYSDGDAYLISFSNGNTVASPTLNINGLGAITLYRNNDGQLLGGDISPNGTMLCVYDSGLNVFQCIGTSPNTLFAYVTNGDSTTITKGQPVYAFSGTGDRMVVKLAYNTSDATSARTMGLVYSTSIAANQKGIIIIEGLLDGLDTLPTSTYSDGDTIYLGATAGSITKTKPYAPNHMVYLGVVTTASSGNAGRMYVKVQNGFEMDEIHDVDLITTSPINNDVLTYVTGTNNLWKPKSVTSILGYTPEDVANKVTTMTGNTTSNVLYLTAKAIYDWAIGLFVQTTRNLTVNGTTADLSSDRTFTVTDANLSTSDVTTNDVSTTKHGFAPKLPNDATKYLDGTGNYTTPSAQVPNVQTVTSAATVTPTSANDEVVITAQAVGLTLANPTGTPSEGQAMTIRIKDNGTSQIINYDTQYRAVGITLPTATTISKTLYLGLIYNSTDTKWDVVGVSLEGADALYDSGWVDYSAISTIVGWSSFTNKVLRYRVVGKQVFVTWFFLGTSNSTSVTFTLPQTINSSCANMGYAVDNGVASGVSYIVGSSGTSTITQYKTDLSGSWTASGTKRAAGQIFFEIA